LRKNIVIEIKTEFEKKRDFKLGEILNKKKE